MKIVLVRFALFLTIFRETEHCSPWINYPGKPYAYSAADTAAIVRGGRKLQGPTTTVIVDRDDAKESYGILYDESSKLARKFADGYDECIGSNLKRYNRIARDYVVDNEVVIGSGYHRLALERVIAVIGMDRRRKNDFTFPTTGLRRNGRTLDARDAAEYDGPLFFMELKRKSQRSEPVSYAYVKDGVERLCGMGLEEETENDRLPDANRIRRSGNDGTIEDGDEIGTAGIAEKFEEVSKKTEVELDKIMVNLDECSAMYPGHDRSPWINLNDLYNDLIDRTKHVHLELLNTIYRTTCRAQMTKHGKRADITSWTCDGSLETKSFGFITLMQEKISNDTVSNGGMNIKIQKDPTSKGSNSGGLISNENFPGKVERSTRDFVLEYLKFWTDRNLNINNVMAFVGVLSDVYVLAMGTASDYLAKGVFHVLYRHCTGVDITWTNVMQCFHYCKLSVSYLRIFHGLSKRIIEKIPAKWNTDAIDDNVYWKTMERNLLRMIEILTRYDHPKHESVASVETMVRVLDAEYGPLLRPEEEDDGIKLLLKCFMKSITLINQLLLALE